MQIHIDNVGSRMESCTTFENRNLNKVSVRLVLIAVCFVMSCRFRVIMKCRFYGCHSKIMASHWHVS